MIDRSSHPPPWQRHLPNLLTAARLASALLVVLLLAGDPSRLRLGLAAAVFILSSITDALDGWLARRWGVLSRFGRIADPLADKMLVLGTLVMLGSGELGARCGVPGLAVTIIVLREILVSGLRSAVESTGGDFSASVTGKLKMIVQAVLTPALVVLPAAAPGIAPTVGNVLAWIIAAVTAGSAGPYVLRAASMLGADKQEPDP